MLRKIIYGILKRPAAAKVQLSTTKKTMYKGQKSSLKASVLPSKASQNVTWSSSNKKLKRWINMVKSAQKPQEV